jgi:CHAD domain-containing protein
MAKELSGKRYAELIDAWSAFLENPAGGDAPAAERPIVDVATERIRRRYRRMLRRGAGIGAATPPEVLHRLRIDGKKLRYLLEFFGSLYDADTTVELVDALKRLQDELGMFNDLQVQQAALAEHARRLSEQGEPPVETLLTIGRLIEVMRRRERKTRRRFRRQFAAFSSPATRRRVARLGARDGERAS